MTAFAAAGKLTERSGDEVCVCINNFVAQKIRWNRLGFELLQGMLQFSIERLQNGPRCLAAGEGGGSQEPDNV